MNRRELLKWFGAGTIIAPVGVSDVTAKLIEPPLIEVVSSVTAKDLEYGSWYAGASGFPRSPGVYDITVILKEQGGGGRQYKFSAETFITDWEEEIDVTRHLSNERDHFSRIAAQGVLTGQHRWKVVLKNELVR